MCATSQLFTHCSSHRKGATAAEAEDAKSALKTRLQQGRTKCEKPQKRAQLEKANEINMEEVRGRPVGESTLG